MAKKKLVCTNNFCKNSNINLLLTIVSIVWIWRGVWGLTDIVIFSYEIATLENVLGYGFPIILGLLYLYLNDYSLDELAHGSPND